MSYNSADTVPVMRIEDAFAEQKLKQEEEQARLCRAEREHTFMTSDEIPMSSATMVVSGEHCDVMSSTMVVVPVASSTDNINIAKSIDVEDKLLQEDDVKQSTIKVPTPAPTSRRMTADPTMNLPRRTSFSAFGQHYYDERHVDFTEERREVLKEKRRRESEKMNQNLTF